MNYFAIQCFPDTYNLVREGPNITPHVTDLMVHAKKILGQEGRCELDTEVDIDTEEDDTIAFNVVNKISILGKRLDLDWTGILDILKQASDILTLTLDNIKSISETSLTDILNE